MPPHAPHTPTCNFVVPAFWLFFCFMRHVKAYLWRDLIVLACAFVVLQLLPLICARMQSCKCALFSPKYLPCYLLYFLLPYSEFIEKHQKTFIYATKLHYSCIVFIFISLFLFSFLHNFICNGNFI